GEYLMETLDKGATISPTQKKSEKRGTKTSANGSSNDQAQAARAVSDTPYDSAVLLAALQSMRDGDFTVRLPGNWTGIEGKIADTFNDIVAANSRVASELERVGRAVGEEGKTRHRM